MTATHEGIALRTANPADRIALRGVRLRARVAGMSLKATVEQTFVNLEPRAIEAVYTFPLPEAAAVCGFEVVFFDKVFTGVVDEADRAVERYDDAIAEGHGAYLLEQHRPDVFSVRVGNLKPRQAVTVRLSYVTDLQITDRTARLAFPTTIAPRYTTASGSDPIDAAVDGDALNPPHVLSVPYGLSMDLEIDLGKNLRGIESPSHAITARRAQREGEAPAEPSSRDAWHVTLAAGLTEMNRDLVLTLNLAREQEPFALAATSPSGERYVALNFLPEFDPDDLAASADAPRSETVFVLDCSGSMDGDSIRQATAALECCLRAMSAGDTFNVCRFGSTFEMLAPEPLPYTDQTLRNAIAFIRQGANLGGTELLAPLDTILRPPSSLRRSVASSLPRNIVLLTDGQVTNEPAIIALAHRHRSRNRLFTFGIGHGASHFLVTGLARATGGAAEFIAPGERIEEKVLRTFGRLASPPVTDVEIDWGNADAQIAPRTLPPLFDGDALRVFARVPGKLPETVTLRCKTATGPKSWPVRLREAADPADLLPTLWARAMIRTLEEDDGVQQTVSISAPSADRAKLVEISKRYNVVCGLTSFIAVEHRSLEDRNEGRPALRRVPIQMVANGLTLTDDDFEDRAFIAARAAMPAAAPMASFRCSASDCDADDGLLDLTREADDTVYGSPVHSMDKSLDRSIDKSIDLSGVGDGTSDDPTQAPLIKLVRAMITEAVRKRASEIHVEPMKDRVQVRYRVDGAFTEQDRIPLSLKGPLITRLKIMAGMNVTEKRLPQDGRYKQTIDQADIDFHVSTLPTSQGESVVLRVLSPAEAAAAPPPAALGDAVLQLLAHQGADGSFDESATVEHVVRGTHVDRSNSMAAIDRLLHDAHVPSAVRPKVAHTFLILLVLRTAFADRQTTWQRAFKKGLRYLTDAAQFHPGQAATWLGELEAASRNPA